MACAFAQLQNQIWVRESRTCPKRNNPGEARKKLEKAEKKAAAKKAVDTALEAAFDNELDDLLAMFDKGLNIETRDEHGTKLLTNSSSSPKIASKLMNCF